MKAGQFIAEKELIRLGYVKIVKYGSIAFVYRLGENGVIWDSINKQIFREVTKEEIENIVEAWKHVLYVNGITK